MKSIEAVGNYLGDLGNRVVGRSAWMETIRQADELSALSPAIQSVRYLDQTLRWSAPLNTLAEILLPVTYKLFIAQLDAFQGRTPVFAARLPATVAADIALVASAIWLARENYPAIAGLKLVTNIAIQAGSDLIGTLVNKSRNHRPSSTTLAV